MIGLIFLLLSVNCDSAEALLLAGLTDKMRSDFNMMKDLAIHTRLPPEQRQRELGRLLNYIQKYGNFLYSLLKSY